jgi:hypothetical protein
MMLLWSTIFATLVGLASAVVFPRDSGFYTLTQDKIDSTDVYANYAAAVKCDPLNIMHWKCGRAYLICVPFFFSCRRKGSMSQFLTHRFPCPVHCDANPNFEVFANGGNGDTVQYCAHVHRAVNFLFLVICMLTLSTGFVGFDKAMNTTILAHQGTDKKKL